MLISHLKNRPKIKLTKFCVQRENSWLLFLTSQKSSLKHTDRNNSNLSQRWGGVWSDYFVSSIWNQTHSSLRGRCPIARERICREQVPRYAESNLASVNVGISITQLNSITESRFEILQRIGCKNHFASRNCIQLKLLTPESKPPQIIGKFFCPLHGRPRHTGVCVLVGRILHCRLVRAAKKKNQVTT